MYRQTYLEVNCETLKNNIINIKENYPNYQYYFGVVKANAYGHGSYIINSLIEGRNKLPSCIIIRRSNKTT